MEHIVLFIPSGGELIVVVLFALLFFGADAIPGLARTVGKGMREFKKATDDIKNEFESHTADIKQDLTKMSENLEKSGSEVKRKIDEELKD
jgi:sec-independent protein translocase protein TatA